MIAQRLVIRGLVQGVGYRNWMVRRAASLGLAGWVRNCPDGTVEALVQGPEDAVAAAVAACWHGPRLAAVSTMERHPAVPAPLSGFHAAPDACPDALPDMPRPAAP